MILTWISYCYDVCQMVILWLCHAFNICLLAFFLQGRASLLHTSLFIYLYQYGFKKSYFSMCYSPLSSSKLKLLYICCGSPFNLASEFLIRPYNSFLDFNVSFYSDCHKDLSSIYFAFLGSLHCICLRFLSIYFSLISFIGSGI